MDHKFIAGLNEQRLDELTEYLGDCSEQNSENIKNLFLKKITKKRSSGKRVLLVAAVVAAFVALSGIAYAATMGFDFGRIRNSFFNNPSAEHKIESGQTVSVGGIDVTLVSAFFDENKAYIMIEVRDLEGKRMSDTMRVLSGGTVFVSTDTVIYDEAENKATLMLSVNFGEPVGEDGTVHFDIETILSDVEYIESKTLNFNISTHAKSTETISYEEWCEAVEKTGASSYGSGYSGDFGRVYRESGKPDPEPLALGDMNAVIDGVDWAVVSNAGVIDNLLHLQIKYTDAYNSDYNCGAFHLLDAHGNVIDPFFDVRGGDYLDMVFDIGDAPTLADLKLTISGTRIGNVILGPWELSFTSEQELPKGSITVFPEESPYFAKLEIECSSMSTRITMSSHNLARMNWDTMADYEEFNGKSDSEILEIMGEYIDRMIDYFNGFEQPYLTLNDGSIISLELGGSGVMFDYYGGEASYVSEYFDIQSLRSITFCGEEYYFDSTP